MDKIQTSDEHCLITPFNQQEFDAQVAKFDRMTNEQKQHFVLEQIRGLSFGSGVSENIIMTVMFYYDGVLDGLEIANKKIVAATIAKNKLEELQNGKN